MIQSNPFPLKGSWPLSGSWLLCLIVSGIAAVLIRMAFTHDSIEWGERYRPFTGAVTRIMSFMILFTVFLLTMGILFPGVILPGLTSTADLDLFRMLVPLIIWHLILWLLIPVLRKHFDPAFCAVCWTLPNIIYFTERSHISLFDGLIIIPVPSAFLKTAVLIWLGGFLAVMTYRIISHLRFRKGLLEESTQIREGHVYDLYLRLLKEHRCQNTYRLYVSKKLNTPLTVGTEDSSTVIILPDRDYTDEQLELIFRHELVHIQRQDPFNKFFMSVVCAAGWFIPFVWMTSSRAAQDLELSCDQTVLKKCNDSQKKEYARLILSASGDERGYTTCLAADAEDLKYRLREIVKPARRRYGTVFIFLFCFLILSTYGTVLLAEECGTLERQIMAWSSEKDADCTVTSVWADGLYKTVSDTKGLYECISEKELLRLPANPFYHDNSMPAEAVSYDFRVHCGNDTFVLNISGRECRIWHMERGSVLFLLKEPLKAEDLKPYLE